MDRGDGDHAGEAPALSVVVPVRNGLPWLEEQLGALVAQSCAEPFELVVADNGSVDASRTVAEWWAERHPVVRVVDASARPGVAAARNIGASLARSQQLVFCDADDVVTPGWLEACRRTLASVDVSAGIFDFWSLNGLPPTDNRPASMHQLGFLPAGLGANLAVRRGPFEQVGGFDERLTVGEDVDLCWRLQHEGYRFVIDFDAVVAKRERQDVAAVFRQAAAYGRSGPLLYRRHRPMGARRDLWGAARSWAWLVIHASYGLSEDGRRLAWARAAGMRTGRLVGSVREGVFFP